MEKTIAAISTGMTQAGISIVRMSGSEAIEIADRIYRGKRSLKKAATHTIRYGFITDGTKDLDEVLVSVMRAPKTYTGEDIVEINCHGGMLVTKEILSLLLRNGASLAEPGEFTKRAFLNGKIDLSRAEAVANLIEAKNTFALSSSVRQLKGDVYTEIRSLREEILDETAFIEAALDDPEHYDLEGFEDSLSEKVTVLKSRLHRLIQRAEYGVTVSEGIRTVICGRPNAGKSSLLNILAGYEKAIVTEVAGTTRDVLEEQVRIGELSLLLMDTAGIRTTDDRVEKIGVDKAKAAIRDADLVLYVIDSQAGVTAEDLEVLDACREKKVILLYNKTDLYGEKTVKPKLPEGHEDMPAIPFSAVTRRGLDILEEMIISMFDRNDIAFNDEVMITSVRHKKLLEDAFESLGLVTEGIESAVSEEFLTVDLMNAYASLGEIIGEEVNDDVVNRVFEKFCMGK